MHPTLFLLSFRLPQPGSNFVQYKIRNIMDLSDITRLISSLRAQTAKDSITPNGLGSILQRIVDAISSMSGIDVEDEEAILQRLSAAESNASTALQAAQNAQAGAAGNVIDSFTHSQDEDELSLSIKQHGHSAQQVVLPAASSTGAGIMTATDKSQLDTAYRKRVNLMSAPSSESVVTLTITFGDGTTKSVTFVGATAGVGGKAGLMTKEQADQLAALVAADPAESVRDDAGYLKQQYAAPIILRNVTDTVFDDLAIGDVYYDTGHLFYHTEDQSGDLDIGAPSRKVIYYCLADQTLYRWTGSRFVQAVSVSSGDVTVPTKLSDLVNDMGYLTAHQPLKTINGQTITGTGNITIDGAAELKDASNHVKQNSATPVVLRNVADTLLDDLNEGDVYFDSGHLFWHTESTSGDIDLGTPSKRLVYFCLGNSNFYRWGGSNFTKINMPAGADGTTPHIDPTTGNWFIGTTNTGVHAQGPKGNSVADGDTFEIVNNLTDGGEGDALSAEMGKELALRIDEAGSGGGTTVTITKGGGYVDIDIIDNTPRITLSPQSIAMSGNDKTATFKVSGVNLKGPISINGNNAYFSKSPRSISPVGGVVNEATVTVTFGGDSDDTDDIIVSSPGATAQTIHVAYTAVAGPNIVVSPDTLSFKAATNQTQTKQVAVQGSLLTDDVEVTAGGAFQVSLQSDSGFANSVTIPKASALAGITVYVRYTAGSSATTGTLTLTSDGAADKTVDLAGAVVSLTVSESSLSFSTTAGTPATQTFTVQGANLSDDISISVSGTGFSVSPATIDKDDAGTAQTVTVTYNPSAAGSHTGTVTIQSSGLSQTIDLSGTAVGLPEGLTAVPYLQGITRPYQSAATFSSQWEFDVQCDSPTTAVGILACANSAGGRYAGATTIGKYGVGLSAEQNTSVDVTTRSTVVVTFTSDGISMTIGNETVNRSAGSNHSGYVYILGVGNESDRRIFPGKVYSIKCLNEDIGPFILCKNSSDQQGIYDVKTQTFFNMQP